MSSYVWSGERNHGGRGLSAEQRPSRQNMEPFPPLNHPCDLSCRLFTVEKIYTVCWISPLNMCSTFQCHYMYRGKGTHRIQSGRKLMMRTRSGGGYHQPQVWALKGTVLPLPLSLRDEASFPGKSGCFALPLPHPQAGDVQRNPPFCSSTSRCQSWKMKSECDVPLWRSDRNRCWAIFSLVVGPSSVRIIGGHGETNPGTQSSWLLKKTSVQPSFVQALTPSDTERIQRRFA